MVVWTISMFQRASLHVFTLCKLKFCPHGCLAIHALLRDLLLPEPVLSAKRP